MKRADADSVRPNVELHIEELILDGFASHDRRRIGAAIERELARLLSEQGAPGLLTESRQVARLNGGQFDVTPHARAETIGAQVARSVYKGMAR